MAKWDDKHMYNWVGWMRSISALHKKVDDWCFIKYSFPRFMAFYLTLTLGSILKYTLIGLMSIPQTIEWIMANIIDGVDYLIVNNNKEEDQYYRTNRQRNHTGSHQHHSHPRQQQTPKSRRIETRHPTG